MRTESAITIVGAGLAGSLLAVFLARRGIQVTVYERNPDLRRHDIPAGRSINLALAHRGMRALEAVGLLDKVRKFLIPMRGRMLHDEHGQLSLAPYGRTPGEVIYSVSRPGLNRVLMDAAEAAGARLIFRQSCEDFEPEDGQLHLRDTTSDKQYTLQAAPVIAADGAGSAIRHALVRHLRMQVTEDLLPHGYKELTIPAAPGGKHPMDAEALHIWPRGGYMLIALPNPDGSFTATLFLANEGSPSFTALHAPAALALFFRDNFSDVQQLLPDFATEFYRHPTGTMGTVHCPRWHVRGQVLLIGDAAHAIVPFHGQGMNCAFEDCLLLDRLVEQHGGDWARVFAEFERRRRPDAEAIAEMALENYVEMRDVVRDPRFHLQKQLGFRLEARHPGVFVPRYSMVMFHDLPYAEAQRRGAIEKRILDELTHGLQSIEKVDMQRADDLIRAELQDRVRA